MENKSKKYFYLCVGWIFTALGFIGAFLPVMPTTVFLIIAVWAFGKSSSRLHEWLMTHPRFGPHLNNWYEHGAISPKAKIMAVSIMALSVGFSFIFCPYPTVNLIVAIVMVSIATFILTRPHGSSVAFKSH